MQAVAEFMSSCLYQALPTGQALVNIASTDRFVMYKVGPVLTVSVSICLYSLNDNLILKVFKTFLKFSLCIFSLSILRAYIVYLCIFCRPTIFIIKNNNITLISIIFNIICFFLAADSVQNSLISDAVY